MLNLNSIFFEKFKNDFVDKYFNIKQDLNQKNNPLKNSLMSSMYVV